MDFTSSTIKRYFRDYFEKAKKNYNNELVRSRAEFVQKYPYAKISEFEFWVNISKQGDITKKTLQKRW